MPSFHLVSDTHVNTYNILPDFVANADYVLLAGDIGDPYDKSYVDYLIKAANKYKLVFLVTGNHEYDNYHGELDRYIIVDDLIKHHINCLKIKNNINNIVFLQKGVYETDTFRILGCTLWSNMTQSGYDTVNGFGLFKKFEDCQKIHNDHLEWLSNEIPKSTKPTIVLVHFGPLNVMSGIHNNSNSAYVTELPQLFVNPVVAVCSGHVHSNVITKYNNIYSVSNSLGYPNEPKEVVKYDGNLILNIN